VSATATRPDTAACSSRSLEVGEPLAGSAPVAGSWIMIEEPGPWGRDALRESSVPPPLADWFEHLGATVGTRAMAARHARRRRLGDEPRNVWIAISDPTMPDGQVLRHAMVDQLTDIMQWDLQGLAEGRLPDIGTAVSAPLEFICTHSGRDTCCALLGKARARQRPQSWECSHLGGHRFAATSVVLPFGAVFGRLGPLAEFDTAHLRGASYLPPALQVAEIAVRRDQEMSAFEPLTTRLAHQTPSTHGSEAGTAWAEVTSPSGASWTVRCESSTIVRPASCHSEASEATFWAAIEIASNRVSAHKETE